MIYSIYNNLTGFFLSNIQTSSDQLNVNVKDGQSCLLGEYDFYSQKVDVATGLVVDYIPPQPTPNDVWNTTTKRWEYVKSLDDLKADCWEAIKLARTTEETSPFMYKGVLYDSNKEQISGAVQMALLSKLGSIPFTIDWTTFDNSVQTLDATAMIELGQALGAHVNGAYEKGRAYRTQIATATMDTIGTIKWS